MEPKFDLFGHPVREGHGQRGRPPFEITDRIRNKVKLLLAMGWATQRIAHAIEASPATLKRYFRAELKDRDAMRDRFEARRLEIAMEQANAGNITALRELGALAERNDRMEAERSMSAASPAPPAKKVGKKAMTEQQAISADADLMAELEAEAEQNTRLHS